jgi:DNA-binding beta-propeller fold protein YncE
MRMLRSTLLPVLMALTITSCPAQAPQYRIANRFAVPGDGRWDLVAVDEATGRVFLSHGMETNVVDEHTGKLLGTVPDTRGAHGIAIAPDQRKGYISCGKDTSVVVFDPATCKVLHR